MCACAVDLGQASPREAMPDKRTGPPCLPPNIHNPGGCAASFVLLGRHVIQQAGPELFWTSFPYTRTHAHEPDTYSRALGNVIPHGLTPVLLPTPTTPNTTTTTHTRHIHTPRPPTPPAPTQIQPTCPHISRLAAHLLRPSISSSLLLERCIPAGAVHSCSCCCSRCCCCRCI